MDYNKIIKRSWEVTWKNKWLWVPALALATFSGGGRSGGGGGGSSSSSSSPSGSPIPVPQDIEGIKNTTSYVLGESASRLSSWFSNIPVENWIALILILGLAIIIGSIFIWILTSWAKGALIHGFEEANSDKSVTLSSISPRGIANIKNLILFNLVSFGMNFLFVLGLFLLIGIGFLLYLFLGVVATILYSVMTFILFIFCILILTMISIYAERLIVLKAIKPWEAWKKGLSLSKGNFFSTLWMGIINSTLGCLGGCLSTIGLMIVMAVPGFLLIYPIFKDGFKMPSLSQIISILLLFSIFVSASILIKAILTVFNYGNWNLFF